MEMAKFSTARKWNKAGTLPASGVQRMLLLRSDGAALCRGVKRSHTL